MAQRRHKDHEGVLDFTVVFVGNSLGSHKGHKEDIKTTKKVHDFTVAFVGNSLGSPQRAQRRHKDHEGVHDFTVVFVGNSPGSHQGHKEDVKTTRDSLISLWSSWETLLVPHKGHQEDIKTTRGPYIFDFTLSLVKHRQINEKNNVKMMFYTL